MQRAFLQFIIATLIVASASVALAQQYRTDGFVGPGAGGAGPTQFDRTMQTEGGG